jgi:hypothetical protein
MVNNDFEWPRFEQLSAGDQNDLANSDEKLCAVGSQGGEYLPP